MLLFLSSCVSCFLPYPLSLFQEGNLSGENLSRMSFGQTCRIPAGGFSAWQTLVQTPTSPSCKKCFLKAGFAKFWTFCSVLESQSTENYFFVIFPSFPPFDFVAEAHRWIWRKKVARLKCHTYIECTAKSLCIMAISFLTIFWILLINSKHTHGPCVRETYKSAVKYWFWRLLCVC